MMRVATLLAGLLVILATVGPSDAHHVGVFTPKDDEITKNFRAIRAATQAGRFDLALGLFEDGAIRAFMAAEARRLPPGVEEGVRTALRASDERAANLGLGVVLAFMAGERLRLATDQFGRAGVSPDARREGAGRLLDAAWRYYNLADFVILSHDAKASVRLRIAFEDAATYLGRPAGDTTPARAPEPDDERAIATFAAMRQALDGFIRTATGTASAGPAPARR